MMLWDVAQAGLELATVLSPGALLLVKATLLLGAAWGLHFALTRANPRWRTMVWRGAAAGLVLLGVWSIGMPNIVIPVDVPGPLAPGPMVVGARPQGGEAVAGIAADVTRTTPTAMQTTVRPEDDVVESVGDAPSVEPMAWRGIVLGVWGFVAAALLARLAIGHVVMRRAIRQSAAAPGFVVDAANRIAGLLGCRRVEVRCCGRFTIPFLYGFRRPVLVLPEGMCVAARYSELPGVIAHELAHVWAGDFVWNAVLQVASIVLWFHPLAWRMGSAHRGACDAVCDAVSASYLGNTNEYCRTLARVALAGAGAAPAVGLAMARVCDVRRRIAALQRKVFAMPPRRRIVLAATATAAFCLVVLAGVRLAMAADAPGLKAAADWARQRGWKAAEIEKTDLKSSWGSWWRNLPFEISAEEEKAVRECLALRQKSGATINEQNQFDLPAVREALEGVLARRPGFFYAEYLLSVWHRSNGDTAKADELFERSLKDAPAIIVQRFEAADGRPVADVAVDCFALECNRVKNGWLDPSLELKYLRLKTDKDGCIYLPAYKTVYRRNDMATPHGGYRAEWPRLGWFECSARVGVLPACVLTKEGQVDAAEGRQSFERRLQGAEMAKPGHVADLDGRPIAGAVLKRTNSEWTATTDAKGYFVLPAMKPGESAQLQASARGFLPLEYVSLYRCPDGRYDLCGGWPIRLARPATLSGRVLGPDGKPLAGAPLSIDTSVAMQQDNCVTGNFREVVTDAQGRFTMEGIPPGSHGIYYPGVAPLSIPIKGVWGSVIAEPADGEKLDGLVIDLSKSTGSVRGRVFGPDGKPLAGTEVMLSLIHEIKHDSTSYEQTTGPNPSARTDEGGRYKVTGLGPGRWRLQPSHLRFQRRSPSEDVAVAVGQSVAQDLRVTIRHDPENSLTRAAAEAERSDDLSKLERCSYGTSWPPFDQNLARANMMIFLSLAPGEIHGLHVNFNGLGLPRTAAPEQVARAAHAGEMYFVAPDTLVTVNGTIIARFKSSQPADRFADLGGLRRADLVEQVEASRRKTPDADGRRIKVKDGEQYIVVRDDGKAFLMYIRTSPMNVSPSFFYIGRLSLSTKATPSEQPSPPPTPRAEKAGEIDKDAETLAAIKKLSGFAFRNMQIPGQPIVSVQFEGADDGDAALRCVKGLSQLRSLKVHARTGWPNVTDAGLEHLRGLTDLNELDLSQSDVTDAGLASLEGLTKLRRLSLYRTKVSNAGVREHLKNLTKLESLDIGNSEVDDDGLRYLEPFERLRQVGLVGGKFSGAGMVRLQKLPRLESVIVSYSRIADDDLRTLAKLPNLRHLDVSHTKVSDAGLAHVGTMSKLESLNISATQTTDRGLSHLGGLGQLVSLNLRSTAVTDEGLRQLGALSRLEQLYLEQTAVQGPGLEHLGQLAHLKYLSLWDTNITDEGAERLRSLTQIAKIDLRSDRITAAGLKHLADVRQLQRLSLGVELSDADVKYFGKLTSLCELFLPESEKLTKKGIKELRSALPRCNIMIGPGE